MLAKHLKATEVKTGVEDRCPVCGEALTTIASDCEESVLVCGSEGCFWAILAAHANRIISDPRLAPPPCSEGHVGAWAISGRSYFGRLNLTCRQLTDQSSVCGNALRYCLNPAPRGFLAGTAQRDVTLSRVIAALLEAEMPLTQGEIIQMTNLTRGQIAATLRPGGKPRRWEYFEKSTKQIPVFPHGAAFTWQLSEYGRAWGKSAIEHGLIKLGTGNER